MQKEQLDRMLSKQKEYFRNGLTLPLENRLVALDVLYMAIKSNEEALYAALKADLGKSRDEAYMCEIGLTLSEITWMRKHLKRLAKERRVRTPLAQFHSRSFVKPSPKGNVLIMSPWNYPVLLTLEPLADALAAGNTAIIKPSAYAPATMAALKTLIRENFEPGLVEMVEGGREENQQLLSLEFDHIFFTGSQNVGKVVMRAASEHLTPVSLELGGKSPCIVEKSADVKLAARRIVFGKYLNCGQTCVAPDYILVDESIRDRFIGEVKEEIKRQYGEDPLKNDAYGKIITKKHFERLTALIEGSPVIFGGNSDAEALRIAPTVLYPINWDSKIMQDEIFGPIMPIMTYSDLDEVLKKIDSLNHPLAFYIFSKDKEAIRKVKEASRFGGGCINDTIIHLATSEMGFGGFGASGMGSYHGKEGFDCFSHMKSIVDKKCWLDLPMRYQPYTKRNGKMIKMFLK